MNQGFSRAQNALADTITDTARLLKKKIVFVIPRPFVLALGP